MSQITELTTASRLSVPRSHTVTTKWVLFAKRCWVYQYHGQIVSEPQSPNRDHLGEWRCNKFDDLPCCRTGMDCWCGSMLDRGCTTSVRQVILLTSGEISRLNPKTSRPQDLRPLPMVLDVCSGVTMRARIEDVTSRTNGEASLLGSLYSAVQL